MSSDEAMASSPSTRKSAGRPQKKQKEPSPVEDDEEPQASEETGGEADEDGEYEIEYIVRAEQGLFKKVCSTRHRCHRVRVLTESRSACPILEALGILGQMEKLWKEG